MRPEYRSLEDAFEHSSSWQQGRLAGATQERERAAQICEEMAAFQEQRARPAPRGRITTVEDQRIARLLADELWEAAARIRGEG